MQPEMQPASLPAPRRPHGVAALAILTVAAGAATMVRAAWEPFRSLFDGSLLGSPWLAPAGIQAPPAGVVGAILGAAFVVSGSGLWTLRPWAWWLALIVGAIGLVLSLGSILWMGVWAALLVYLVVVHRTFSGSWASAQTSTY